MAEHGSSLAKSGAPKDERGKAGEAKTVVSARKEKRINWWYDNMNKRLEAGETIPEKPVGVAKKSKEKKDKKFAVFVGQVPFDADEAEVREMFEKVALPGKLKNFRWRISPKTKKFVGFVFVEFENKGAYRRAFELHHALVKGRPINVEATSAGGRKSKSRKDHIKEETVKWQKKAEEAIERKARNEAKRKKPLPETDTTAHTETTPGPVLADTTTDEILSALGSTIPHVPETPLVKKPIADPKKRTLDQFSSDKIPSQNSEKRSNGGDAVKRESVSGAQNSSQPAKKIKQENGERNPGSVEEPRGLQKLKNERRAMDNSAGKPSWIKPKEPHLASIEKPRLHIKFE